MLREKLNEDTITLLKNEKKDVNTIEILETDLFGTKLAYNPPRVLWPNTEALRNMSEGNNIQNADNFTMKYKEEIPKPFKMKVCVKFIYINSYVLKVY